MKILAQILVLILFLSTGLYAQKIIVNSDNVLKTLTHQQLRNIYLGNTNVWENGAFIKISDYSATSSFRKDFSLKFLDLSPSKVSMLWIKVTLKGKSIPPKIFDNEIDVLNFVEQNKDAIGYINSELKFPTSIKVLEIE